MNTKSVKESVANIPFNDLKIGSENEVVKNRFSGESVTLTPDAVAVYDLIIGAEMIGDQLFSKGCALTNEQETNKYLQAADRFYFKVRAGIDWFRKYYPRAYYILLD